MLDKLSPEQEQRIQKFKIDHPEYKDCSKEQILSVMYQCGEITEEELKEISVLYTPKEGNSDLLEIHKNEDSNTELVLGATGAAIGAGLLFAFRKRLGVLGGLFKKGNPEARLQKIEQTFEKMRPERIGPWNERLWNPEAKQTIMDIAETNPKVAELILKRYSSNISDIPKFKEALSIDSRLTEKVLSLKSKPSIIDRLLRRPPNFFENSGDRTFKVVKAMKASPKELEPLCSNYNDYQTLCTIGEIIEHHGTEFLNKSYKDLNLVEKQKLFHILINERGVQNDTLSRLSSKTLKYFPAIPKIESSEYITTIRKLYGDITSSVKIPQSQIEEITSGFERINKTHTEADITRFSSTITDIINQYFPDKLVFEQVQKELSSMINSNEFKNLTSEQQKICMITELLKNYSAKETPLLALNLAKELGIAPAETKQLYQILNSKNYMQLLKDGNKEELDLIYTMLAHDLKEGKNAEIADMLWGLENKNKEVFNIIKNRIKEMKSQDFIMPQSTISDYMAKAVNQNIKLAGESYNVNVVKLSDLDNFYSYSHTLRGTGSTGGSLIPLESVLEKYKYFDNLANENIFCTSYISKDGLGVLDGGIGLLFNARNECQYVGAGYDIGSISHELKYLLKNYFTKNTAMQENVGWGFVENKKGNDLRRIVSDNLKEIMGISDGEYAKRLENIKTVLGENPMTLEHLEKIDSGFAKAYKTLLSRVNNAQEFSDKCILRSTKKQTYTKEVWNEFLIGQPKISGIYINAKSVEQLAAHHDLPVYLKFAQENNIPIVLLGA